jgi:hypothetical protein
LFEHLLFFKLVLFLHFLDKLHRGFHLLLFRLDERLVVSFFLFSLELLLLRTFSLKFFLFLRFFFRSLLSLLLHFLFHLNGLVLKLNVFLDHQLFEGHKVIHCRQLVNDLFVNRVFGCFGTGLHELLVSHSELGDQLAKKLIHDFFELLIDITAQRDLRRGCS